MCNNIGPAGTGSLATALKTNTPLRKLHLHCNNLGQAGVESLAKAIEGDIFVAMVITSVNLLQEN